MNSKTGLIAFLLFCWVPALFLQSNIQDSDFRNWVSKDGQTTIRAEFVSFVANKVRLRREDGKTIDTDPANLSDADNKYLQSLRRKPQEMSKQDSSQRKTSISALKAKEQKLIYAKDILQLYEDALKNGEVGQEDLVFVENKIKKYISLAAENAVEFEGEFVQVVAIGSRRKQGAKLVEEWLAFARTAGDEIDISKLKEATTADPIATDAALLIGYYEYFAQRNYSKAMRYFKDAVRRGNKYLALNTVHDFQNLVTATNCCAVMSTKAQNTRMAIDYWMDALAIKDVPIEATSINLSRFMGIAQGETKGVELKISEQKKLMPMFQKFGAATANGWIFSYPVNFEGKRYSDVKFLVKKLKEGVRTTPNGLEDSVCLICEGRTRAECPYKACKNGVVMVKKRVIVQTPFGPTKEIVQVAEKCKTCNGVSHVQCWGCAGRGIQN